MLTLASSVRWETYAGIFTTRTVFLLRNFNLCNVLTMLPVVLWGTLVTTRLFMGCILVAGIMVRSDITSDDLSMV